MKRTRNFCLMVPCGHWTPYRIEGAIGGTPDIKLINQSERCCRYTLPPFLDELVFHFVESPSSHISMQNFYHLGDFFVVSNTLKEFLVAEAGCHFECKPIKTEHPRGGLHEPYWAIKVASRYDCDFA